MKRQWQLQEAKNSLSEVIDRAVRQGVQIITRRGEETAVILSIEDYRKLIGGSLLEFMSKSPLRKFNLELLRDKDTGCKTDL